MSLIRKLAHVVLVDIPLMGKKGIYSIDESASLGLRFKVKHSVPPVDRNYLTVGKRCILNCQCIFESTEGHIEIGDDTEIGNSTLISREGITFGKNVTAAWGITVYDHNSHSLNAADRRADHEAHYAGLAGNPLAVKDWSVVRSGKILIEDDAWIGMGVTILKGVTVGKGAVIGACSVVTRDVEPYTVVAGNPAKVVKRLNDAR